jgi:hypothetical protein
MFDLEQRKYEIDSTGLVKSRYDSHYVKDGKFKVINNCNNVLKTFLYLKYKDHLHPFAHFVTVYFTILKNLNHENAQNSKIPQSESTALLNDKCHTKLRNVVCCKNLFTLFPVSSAKRRGLKPRAW